MVIGGKLVRIMVFMIIEGRTVRGIKVVGSSHLKVTYNANSHATCYFPAATCIRGGIDWGMSTLNRYINQRISIRK